MRSQLSLLSSYRKSYIIVLTILFVNEALVKNYYCNNNHRRAERVRDWHYPEVVNRYILLIRSGKVRGSEKRTYVSF